MKLFAKIYIITLALSIMSIGFIFFVSAARGTMPNIPGWIFIALLAMIVGSFFLVRKDKKEDASDNYNTDNDN